LYDRPVYWILLEASDEMVYLSLLDIFWDKKHDEEAQNQNINEDRKNTRKRQISITHIHTNI
jgi:hypothetical protein